MVCRIPAIAAVQQSRRPAPRGSKSKFSTDREVARLSDRPHHCSRSIALRGKRRRTIVGVPDILARTDDIGRCEPGPLQSPRGARPLLWSRDGIRRHADMADLACAIRRETLEAGTPTSVVMSQTATSIWPGRTGPARQDIRIVDRCEIKPSSVLLGRRNLPPKRRRVALDQLAERMARGLQKVVAGREAIRARGEAAAHRRSAMVQCA